MTNDRLREIESVIFGAEGIVDTTIASPDTQQKFALLLRDLRHGVEASTAPDEAVIAEATAAVRLITVENPSSLLAEAVLTSFVSTFNVFRHLEYEEVTDTTDYSNLCETLRRSITSLNSHVHRKLDKDTYDRVWGNIYEFRTRLSPLRSIPDGSAFAGSLRKILGVLDRLNAHAADRNSKIEAEALQLGVRGCIRVLESVKRQLESR
jgi:hypothetical protein